MQFLQFLSESIIPITIFMILSYALLNRQNVYQDFLKGAKDGFLTVIDILPTLIGLMTAVGILRASGFLDFLAEGQDRVALGLLGAELGAGFEHVDLCLGVVPQLIRLALCLGDDGVRLLTGVGQDRGSLLICTVNAVLFDGRNKILNLKFHN